MSNCEIVSNVACGKEFQYCRTHKVEPHHCPGAKQEVVFQTPWMTLKPREGYKSIGVDLAAPTLKREFKVGDKVRVLVDRPYCARFKIGDVLTVKSADYDNPMMGWDLSFEGTDYEIYSLENGVETVEHV